MGKTLSIQNVNKSFTVDGQKVDVLKDINLEVQEGEFIAIVLSLIHISEPTRP